MALNVYDPANLTSTPAAGAAPATDTGWSFSKMLADPNFQLLLANMGKAADPEGAGGVIGGATANMISSKAAQSAVEKRDLARQQQIAKLIELHGGLTSPDKPGLNSIKATPAGSLALDLNLGEPDRPVGTGTVLAPPAQQQRTQPLTQAVAPAQPNMRMARQPDLGEIIPFY